MKLKSRYSFLYWSTCVILIQDECMKYRSMSVTNDAENVVSTIHKEHYLPINRKLFYVDTMGFVDELTHDGNGGFMGFKKGFDTIDAFYDFYSHMMKDI